MSFPRLAGVFASALPASCACRRPIRRSRQRCQRGATSDRWHGETLTFMAAGIAGKIPRREKPLKRNLCSQDRNLLAFAAGKSDINVWRGIIVPDRDKAPVTCRPRAANPFRSASQSGPRMPLLPNPRVTQLLQSPRYHPPSPCCIPWRLNFRLLDSALSLRLP